MLKPAIKEPGAGAINTANHNDAGGRKAQDKANSQ